MRELKERSRFSEARVSHLVSFCLALQGVPPCGLTVLVKVDPVAHTSRVSRQKFVVPHFGPGSKFLEPLRITESADYLVL